VSLSLGEFYLAEDYHQKYYLRKLKQLMSELNFSDLDMINSPIATRMNCYIKGNGDKDLAKSDCMELKLSQEMQEYILGRL
jgi:peptide-methionine (S)-S-oxide reductase